MEKEAEWADWSPGWNNKGLDARRMLADGPHKQLLQFLLNNLPL